MRQLRFILIGALTIFAGRAFAVEFAIDPAESIFAVVVHKGGIAAKLAHNHLVYPATYDAKLAIENNDPATAAFTLDFDTTALETDAPDMHKKWYPSIEKAGVLDEAFKPVDDKNRATIREHMLDANQLDAKQFPNISAKLTKVRAEAGTKGKENYTHIATIAFTVHGKTIERECPASVALAGDTATIDALGEFKFSEFGIKPYSAMAGAVKNLDPFHVFVHISAQAK